MTKTTYSRKAVFWIIAIVAAFAALSVVLHRMTPFGQLTVYLTLTLLPGLAIHFFLDREARLLEAALVGLTTGPIITGLAGMLVILLGASPQDAGGWILLAVALVGIVAAASLRAVRLDPALTSRRLTLLAVTIAIFVIVAGYLPLRYEWWRLWSDAWFHAGVVSQIDSYGIPPEDPYFVGFELQYMWFYHVLVLVISKVATIDPEVVMPLLNLNALVGFALGAYLLSTLFKKKFQHGWFAVLFVILAMNALFWMFIPVSLARVLIGETRGWDEFVRTYSRVLFEQDQAWTFLRPYYNQPFLLNKFIVSTALSLALAAMSGAWYGSMCYIVKRRRWALSLTFFASLGMYLLHPIVGLVMLTSIFVTGVLLYFCRDSITDFSLRPLAMVLAAWLAAFIVALPYLYSITHLKEARHFLPFTMSINLSLGMLIGCLLVTILALWQLKSLARERTMGVRMLLLTTVVVIVVANIVSLPGENQFDKPPFLVFYPLAIIASWALADRFARRHAGSKYRRKVLVVALLLLLPVNVVALVAYFNTPRTAHLSGAEERVAAWARADTPRDAIFFDSGDRVFLLVTGPRRYYYGRRSYAEQWGYSVSVMTTRRQVRDNLYSGEPLEESTIAELGALPARVYLIVRDDRGQTDSLAKFEDYPALFKRVYETGPITVLEVDRDACRESSQQPE